METKNVAIVGIENSHAEEIIRYLNVEQPADVPVRVVALVAGEDERTRELAALGGIDRIVAESSDLLGMVDALIVTSRDGALHRAHAVPFLEAGTPVWVDKPLAASVADAEEIIAAAERGARRSPRRRPCAGSSTPTWSRRGSPRSAISRRSP